MFNDQQLILIHSGTNLILIALNQLNLSHVREDLQVLGMRLKVADFQYQLHMKKETSEELMARLCFKISIRSLMDRIECSLSLLTLSNLNKNNSTD